jgi:hypothetical protein
MEDKTRLTPPTEMPTELATRILEPQEKTRVNASVKPEKSGSNEERFLLIGDKFWIVC